MTEFIRAAILEKIRSHITAPGIERNDFAVAYWGKGSAKLIGLSELAEVRLLCDLRSGLCNPDEMLKLLGRKETVKIKTRDELHAKVYLAPKTAAVVGSANASRRGLETSTELEAAVLVNDGESLSAIGEWFDALWNDEESDDVDETMVENVRPLWRLRKWLLKRPSLLFAIDRNPELFDRVHFAIFLEPHRKQAEEDHREMWDRIRRPVDSHETSKYGPPIYIDESDWGIRRGDFVINYWFSADDDKMEYGGVWQLKDIKRLAGKRVLVADRVERTGPLGFKFGRREQNELGNRMRKYLHKHHKRKVKSRTVIEIPPREIAALNK